MFKTPNLHRFLVTWYMQTTQLPFPADNDEFLTERFIEDIMDGRQSIALVVEETQVPNLENYPGGRDVPIVFKVLTTEDQACQLLGLGYRIRPEKPDEMDKVWDDEDDGMTWTDLLAMLNGKMRPMGPELEKQVRATDDNDPNAPWFKLMGIKKDDDGWFIAIEEIVP